MSKRFGRSYMVEDKHIVSIIEVIPVTPRGWIFWRDDKIMYGGMVFSYKDAMRRMETIEYAIASRAKIHGDKGFAIVEITDRMPEQPPIPAPTGCVFLAGQDVTDETKEDTVFPMLPAHNEDLKAEE